MKNLCRGAAVDGSIIQGEVAENRNENLFVVSAENLMTMLFRLAGL